MLATSILLQVPLELVDGLIQACKKPAFSEVESAVSNLFAEGYSANAVLEQLLKKLMESAELKEAGKAKVAGVMAAADKKLVDGADGTLQMLHVLSVLQQVCQGA